MCTPVFSYFPCCIRNNMVLLKYCISIRMCVCLSPKQSAEQIYGLLKALHECRFFTVQLTFDISVSRLLSVIRKLIALHTDRKILFQYSFRKNTSFILVFFFHSIKIQGNMERKLNNLAIDIFVRNYEPLSVTGKQRHTTECYRL